MLLDPWPTHWAPVAVTCEEKFAHIKNKSQSYNSSSHIHPRSQPQLQPQQPQRSGGVTFNLKICRGAWQSMVAEGLKGSLWHIPWKCTFVSFQSAHYPSGCMSTVTPSPRCGCQWTVRILQRVVHLRFQPVARFYMLNIEHGSFHMTGRNKLGCCPGCTVWMPHSHLRKQTDRPILPLRCVRVCVFQYW